jgi:hypothetical protein
MSSEEQNADAICARLIALGYSQQSRVRMYGEEFELISNPFVDQNGFAVHAVSTRSRETKKLQIPLYVLRAVMLEVERSHGTDAA